jgi:uncharacterized membrane protein
MQARLVLAAVVSLVYVAGSQWLMVSAPASPWSAFVLLAPMLAVACGWGWRVRQRWFSLCAAGGVLALFLRALWGSDMAVEKLYVAQHAVIHACLAAWFGGTLRSGMKPLISVLAARVHRQLTPAMQVYTRHVTLAWAVYFIAMVLLSLTIYAVAPFETWATFANLLTPAAMVVMFGGEYVLRYRLHPDFERVSMMDAVRAYMHTESTPASAPADHGVPRP